MSRKGKKVEESNGPKVPSYIVTFSDMVTLLLTFFVMLLSLANTQDVIRFKRGQEAFVRSIKQFGLGMVFGRKSRPDFGHVKERFFVPEPSKFHFGRMINAKEEETRKIFKTIAKNAETMRSQIVAKNTNFSVTNIYFPAGETTLDSSSQKYLSQFCTDFQRRPDFKGVKVCVLGLANDETGGKRQWILSARRAKAVADFIKGALPSEYEWPIYSWGIGSGGTWLGEDSSVSKQSQILFTILRADM